MSIPVEDLAAIEAALQEKARKAKSKPTAQQRQQQRRQEIKQHQDPEELDKLIEQLEGWERSQEELG